jgi:hypothetical protein
LGIVALLVVARFSVVAALPWIVNREARKNGLAVRWERLDLSLLRGELELANVVVSPVEGAPEPLATLGFVRVDLRPTKLFANKVHVKRVIVDEISLLVDRDADGELAFVKTIESARAAHGMERLFHLERPKEPLREKLERLARTKFGLIVEAVRIQHVRVRIRDASVKPSLDARLDAEVRVSDVALNEELPRPARFELSIACAPLLDSFHVEGQWNAVGEQLTSAFFVTLERLHWAPFSGYLEPLGIEPSSSELSGGARIHTTIVPSLEARDAMALSLSIDGSHLAADGTEVLALDRVALEAPRVSPTHIRVSHIDVVGLRAGASRAKDDAILALGLRVKPRRPPAAEVAPAKRPAKAPGAWEPALSALPHKGRPSPVLELGELAFKDFRGAFHDDAVSPPATLGFTLERASVRGLRLDTAAPDAAATIDARLSAPGVVEEIAVVGTAVPFAIRRELEMKLAMSGIAPRALAPYLAQAGLGSTLEHGSLELGVRASVERRGHGPYVGEVEVSNVSFRDGDELAGLDLARIAGVRIDPERLTYDVDSIEIARPRAHARRDDKGALVVGGVRVPLPLKRPAKAAAEGTSEPARPKPAPAAPPEEGASVAAAPEKVPTVRVAHIYLHDASARLDDEATDEPSHLVVSNAGLEVLGVVSDLTPGTPAGVVAPLRAWLTAPGLCEGVAVVGSLAASTSAPSLSFTAVLDDLTLKAAAPLLRAYGIQSTLERGRVEVTLHADAQIEPRGPVEANVVLDRLSLTDRRTTGDRELLLVEGAGAEGLRVSPSPTAPERIIAQRVTLGRLRGTAALDPKNVVEALGLVVEARRRAPEAAPVASATVGTPLGKEPPSWPVAEVERRPLPVVELERLEVGEVALDLHDRSRPGQVDLPLRCGLSLGPIAVDLSGRTPPEPGAFTAWLEAPGTVEAVAVSGQLASSASEAHVTAHVQATGVSGGTLATRLQASGIEPILGAGKLGLELSADATLEKRERITAELSLEKFTFEDAGEELVGVDSVHVRGVALSRSGLSVGDVEVVKPRARARREREDTLVVAGVRLRRPPESKPAESEAPDLSPLERRPLELPPLEPRLASPTSPTPGQPRSPEASPAREPFPIELGRLHVERANAILRDESVSPSVAFEPTVDLSLEGFVVGRDAAPARFNLALSAPGAVKDLSVTGTLEPGLERQAATLEFAAHGLEGTWLEPYLRSRGRVTLRDGNAHAKLEASLERALDGGKSARVVLSDVLYRDGDTTTPLFQLDTVRFIAPRIDPAGGKVTVAELSVTGVEMDVERTETGEARLLGLAIFPPPPASEAAPTPTPTGAGGTAPVSSERPLAGRRRLGRLGKALPDIELSKLDLEVKRLGIVDRLRPDAAPVTVSRLHVRNLKKLELLGPDPASKPPLELEVATEIAPVVKSVVVTLRLAPFAAEPDLGIDLAIDGLKGSGLTQAAPELAEKIDGAPLKDGRARASLTVGLKTGRHDPLDFDVAKGFGADIVLKGVSFRDGATGPVLGGLDDLHIDVQKVVPSTRELHVRSLELTKPAGLVTLESDGLHVLGVVLKKPPEKPFEAAPPPAKEERPEEVIAPEAKTVVKKAATAAQADVRVDRVVLSDMAFLFRDRRFQPEALVPLTDLDVDVVGLSTRALHERRTIRFDARMRGGKVSLPSRAEDSQGRLEQRPLFGELAVKGELSLFPFPIGRIRTDLSGLELQEFAGEAKAQGVDLKDGILDLESDVHLTDRGDLRSKSDALLDSLEASEGENGPMQKKLGIPVPLEAGIFAIRDENGEIELALPVDLDQWIKLTRSELKSRVSDTVYHAIGVIMLNALKSAPLRVVGVGELGLTATEAEKELPITLDFAAGDVAISDSNAVAIAAIAERLNKDTDRKLQVTLRHDVGGGDLKRARIATNPSVADRRDLIARLRARREELQHVRQDATAEARADAAAGLERETQAARLRVQETDEELAKVERSLDELYDLEAEGAERQVERRARRGVIELANARLEAVRALLAAHGIDRADERVHVARPRVEEVPGSAGGTVSLSTHVRKAK